MEKLFKDKLINEQTLTVEESLMLDQRLESQTETRQLLSRLPDVSPSMEWRSSLNEKLMAESKRGKRKVTWRWISGFATTAAVAACVVAVIPLFNSPIKSNQVPPKVIAKDTPSVEESLVSAHKESDLENGLGVDWSQSESEKATGS